MKAKQSTQLQALSRQQRQKLVRDLVEENDKLQAEMRELRPVRDTMRTLAGGHRRVSAMDWTIPLLLGFLMGVGVGVVFG